MPAAIRIGFDNGGVLMLGDREFRAVLPAKDIERARRFYAEKLNLHPFDEAQDGTLMYKCKNSFFGVYPTQFAGTAQNTVGGWETDDLEKDMRSLRANGVVFEEYDLPGLKTVNGIANLGSEKTAWFKDSESNILYLAEVIGKSK
jgi:catechol 2,3-dioxygenase-like lactoylglutathione lyase family enzyme